MVFDVDELALFVDPAQCQPLLDQAGQKFSIPLECMAPIAVIVDPSIWCPVVAEEHESGMISMFIS